MWASSVVFVVVIATWAAYLLFYVSRRREHLATVRTVDRFSAHMRVLERRVAAERGPSSSPVPLVRAVPSSAPYDVVADTQAEATVPEFSPPPRRVMPASAAPRQVAAVGINRGFALLGRITAISAAGFRRILLLVALASSGVGFVTGLLGWTSWVWCMLSVIAVAAVLTWSRWTVRAAHAKSRRSVASRSVSVPAAVALDGDVRGGVEPHQALDVEMLAAAGEPISEPLVVRRPTRTEVFDLQALEATPGMVVGQVYDAATDGVLDPLGPAPGWSPVPVPPPTYTFKAKAPSVQPAMTGAPVPVPVPIEVHDEFDEWQWAGDEARAVNG